MNEQNQDRYNKYRKAITDFLWQKFHYEIFEISEHEKYLYTYLNDSIDELTRVLSNVPKETKENKDV